MSTTILSLLRRELSDLSTRQKLVASYILSAPEEAAFLTSTQLAEASGTSDATVIRFANHLGYKKYANMQQALRELVRGKLTQIERLENSNMPEHHGTLMQTVIDSMRTDITNIEQTLANLREEDLSAVVQVIAAARRVYVIGTHSEYGIACYFASTLSWIKENVYLMDDSHHPGFDSVAGISPGDVLIAMSFPPYPAATVLFLDIAIKRGASTVAITDSVLSPLAQRATHCLLARDEKKFFADSSAPVMSLLAVLLGLISSQDFEKSAASLQRKSAYWEDIGFYYKD